MPKGKDKFTEMLVGGVMITDKVRILNHLNNHFRSVASEILNCSSNGVGSPLSDMRGDFGNSFVSHPISEWL